MLARLAFSVWIAQVAVPAMPDARAADVGKQISAESATNRREQIERQSAATAACHRRFMGQDYWPQPAIWKVADADTTMYLFGTQHLVPRDFEWRSPQLDDIVKDAQLLITEGGGSTSSGAPGSISFPPVVERLRGDDRLLWRGMMAMMPDDRIEEYNRLPTWEVAMRIGRSGRFLRDPPSGVFGADEQLRAIFRAAGKKIEAIESGEAVDRRLTTTPEDEQRMLLAAQVRATAQPRSVVERMRSTHKWGRGEPLEAPNSVRPEQLGELLGAFLDERNAEWATVLSQRMREPGIILVAVGAGHFEGRGSLLDLLARRGLVAERISPVGPPRARAAWIPMPRNWTSCDDYLFGKVPVPPGNE